MNLREQLQRRSRYTARKIVDGLEGREVCLNCGEAGYIEVHHIDGDYLNNHPLNLVPLCRSCHKHAHRAKQQAKRMKKMRADFNGLTSD